MSNQPKFDIMDLPLPLFHRDVEVPEFIPRSLRQLPSPTPEAFVKALELSMWWPQHIAGNIGDVVETTVRFESQVWEFPKERFTTYEPQDESWCRFFGIGRLVPKVETYRYRACIKAKIHDSVILELLERLPDGSDVPNLRAGV